MMTTEEIKALVSETEQKSVLLAAGLSKELVIKSLQDTELGYEFQDLIKEIGDRLGGYLPTLNLYISLLEVEARLYNPLLAYAYGKQAHSRGLDYHMGLRWFQSDVGKSANADLCAEVGRYAHILRTVYGDAPNSLIHPVDQLAALYRQIYGAVGTSEDVFYQYGFENKFETVK